MLTGYDKPELAQSWQMIDLAPRDGTPVRVRSGLGFPWLARWNQDRWEPLESQAGLGFDYLRPLRSDPDARHGEPTHFQFIGKGNQDAYSRRG